MPLSTQKQIDDRFKYAIKNPIVIEPDDENYAARMATRHSNFVKTLEFKRARMGKVCAYAADRFGVNHAKTVALRVRLRELYPPQKPRGLMRITSVGSGSYPQ